MGPERGVHHHLRRGRQKELYVIAIVTPVRWLMDRDK